MQPFEHGEAVVVREGMHLHGAPYGQDELPAGGVLLGQCFSFFIFHERVGDIGGELCQFAFSYALEQREVGQYVQAEAFHAR